MALEKTKTTINVTFKETIGELIYNGNYNYSGTELSLINIQVNDVNNIQLANMNTSMGIQSQNINFYNSTSITQKQQIIADLEIILAEINTDIN